MANSRNHKNRENLRIRHLNRKEKIYLKSAFQKAKPFPHVGIKNFLINHKKLYSALKKEEFFKKDSDLFSFSQTNNLFFAENSIIREAVKIFSSKEFSDLISGISKIKLNSGATDVFGSLYEKTDYLLCHDDRVENRKIAFILYLSKNFLKKDGGALVLYSSKDSHSNKKIMPYLPVQNSLFIFKVSEISWHEVEEVLSCKKRYAIGGWLH